MIVTALQRLLYNMTIVVVGILYNHNTTITSCVVEQSG